MNLQKKLARLARKCVSKKELGSHLRGKELEEAWLIKRIQAARVKAREEALVNGIHYGSGVGNACYGIQNYYLKPQPLEQYERQGIKRVAWKTTRRWPWARHYKESFLRRIAQAVKRDWQYQWRDVDYVLSVSHRRSEVSIKHSRSASGYVSFYTTLTFDLLRQEAVWIGGVLTIRAKADVGKKDYPCWWFERKKDGPGLVRFEGTISDWNHHLELTSNVEARKLKARMIRNAARRSTRPPKDWVTRESSLSAGNCRAGTDSFIRNRLVPHLRAQGIYVGNLSGAAVKKSVILEIQRDAFTARL